MNDIYKCTSLDMNTYSSDFNAEKEAMNLLEAVDNDSRSAAFFHRIPKVTHLGSF